MGEGFISAMGNVAIFSIELFKVRILLWQITAATFSDYFFFPSRRRSGFLLVFFCNLAYWMIYFFK